MTEATDPVVDDGDEEGAKFASRSEKAAKWQRYLSIGLTGGLLIAIVLKLDLHGLDQALKIVPESAPFFWIAFFAYYFTQPVFDWIIFHRLWGLSFAAFPIMVEKRISNEALFNYSGELSFYLWAKKNRLLDSQPFAVIKDVNITSSLTSNFVTIAMLAILYPYIGEVDDSLKSGELFLGAGAVVLISTVILFAGKWVFSLPKPILFKLTVIHLIRALLSNFLLALVWFITLPQTPLISLFALSAVRLFLSRLPLPNVDLMFAAVAVFLIGGDIGPLTTMVAALILVTHILFFVGINITKVFFPAFYRADPPDTPDPEVDPA